MTGLMQMVETISRQAGMTGAIAESGGGSGHRRLGAPEEGHAHLLPG